MKKSLLILVLACLSAGSAFAGTTKVQTFAPQSWSSTNPKDTISIQNQGSATRVFIIVNKYPQIMSDTLSATGVMITGCGNVTQVAPASSVLCPLSQEITISADKNDPAHFIASGTYQVD